MVFRARDLRFPIIAVLIVLCTRTAIADPKPQPNLLANGTFAVGAGNAPDDWRTEAWISTPSATTYRWIPPAAGGPGEVEVQNLQGNDSRWAQTITLPPGWYYFSVEARAEGVGANLAGVSISLLEDGITSPDLHGTADWRRIGFYLKVRGAGADVEVALRVGGFSALNTGTGYFRNATVVAVDGPPANASASAIFDLAEIRKAALPTPIGHPWTLVLTFIWLLGLAFFGWRLYSDPAKAAATPTPRQTTSRANRRRAERRKNR